MTNEQADAVELATGLTVAWLANPNTRSAAEEVPAFLTQMYETVLSLAGAPASEPVAEAAPAYEPAVTVRKSLASKDHLISLIDGKPYKTLRRHLSGHGLTPEDYRARYGLKPDYPMVAEAYSEARRAMAKKIGLGRKPGQKAPPVKKAAAKPKGVAAAKRAAQAHLSGKTEG